jgi:hypothetical protein
MVSPLVKNQARLNLYAELNETGQKEVDDLAARIIMFTGIKGLGPLGARELALSLLEHCWDGSDFSDWWVNHVDN